MFRRIGRLSAIVVIIVTASSWLASANIAEALSYRQFYVYFHKDSSSLTQDSEAVLDAATDFYQTVFPEERLCIVSQTDTVGTADENLARSRDYADSVIAGLVARGIPAGKVAVRAIGETDPPVRTPDDTYEPLNRRAAIYAGDYAWKTDCQGDEPTS